jgi:hypothetical protein
MPPPQEILLNSPARSLLCRATPQGLPYQKIQTCMISVQLGHDPKAGTALQELHFAMLCPPSPTHLCFAGHAPKAYHAGYTNTHYLRSTGPRPQGQHSPAQNSLPKPVPLRSAKPRTHTPTISTLLDHTPPSLSSWGSTQTQDLHSTHLHPSGTANQSSKVLLLHLS